MSDDVTPQTSGERALTLRLDADLHERLRRYAFERRVPMSSVIRDALVSALPTPSLGCDVCGARPAPPTTPGAIRLCDKHGGR